MNKVDSNKKNSAFACVRQSNNTRLYKRMISDHISMDGKKIKHCYRYRSRDNSLAEKSIFYDHTTGFINSIFTNECNVVDLVGCREKPAKITLNDRSYLVLISNFSLVFFNLLSYDELSLCRNDDDIKSTAKALFDYERKVLYGEIRNYWINDKLTNIHEILKSAVYNSSGYFDMKNTDGECFFGTEVFDLDTYIMMQLKHGLSYAIPPDIVEQLISLIEKNNLINKLHVT